MKEWKKMKRQFQRQTFLHNSTKDKKKIKLISKGKKHQNQQS